MRTTAIILLAIGLTSLSSCNQKTNPSAMLENSETRTELFDAIARDQNYMTEFMDNMQDNDHAMQMMKGNQKMAGNMMQGGGMQMMMQDSTMMKNMMQSMMKDGKMMGNMMKMMHEKGMMGEDCMESCKKMMADKGMDMKAMGMLDENELDAIEQGKLELSKSKSHGNHH
tara:strand:+ start:30529 stop:31038 length:510 start_codon:yes stop_codon:yes gene_type:complete